MNNTTVTTISDIQLIHAGTPKWIHVLWALPIGACLIWMYGSRFLPCVSPALWCCARNGCSRLAKCAIMARVDVNEPSVPSQQTPLWEASKQANVEVVESLLSARADPNTADGRYQQTPLWLISSIRKQMYCGDTSMDNARVLGEPHPASWRENHPGAGNCRNVYVSDAIRVMQALLDADADHTHQCPGAINKYMSTPLGIARSAGAPKKVIKVLVDHEAFINTRLLEQVVYASIFLKIKLRSLGIPLVERHEWTMHTVRENDFDDRFHPWYELLCTVL